MKIKSTKKGAFTLVELLVVIAIIALLLAILMPALKKAQAQGRAVVCLSQLKSLGLSMALYQNEYRYLPLVYSWANSYIGDKKILKCPADPYKGLRLYNSALFSPYSEDKDPRQKDLVPCSIWNILTETAIWNGQPKYARSLQLIFSGKSDTTIYKLQAGNRKGPDMCYSMCITKHPGRDANCLAPSGRVTIFKSKKKGDPFYDGTWFYMYNY